MKKTFLWFVILGIILLPLSAMASTSADKQAAIDAGLAYLASTQNPVNGSWNFSTGYAAADTGSALLAFVDEYNKNGANWGTGPDYSSVVTSAANYLLSQAGSISLSANWTGVTGTGLIWGGGEATYVTGLVVPALARLVNNPYGGTTFIGGAGADTAVPNTGSAADGMTYRQVLQSTIDTMAWGQTGAGSRDGGWRYVPNSGDSDMSTTQWPVIDFLFTQDLVTIPNLGPMKAHLQTWIAACQNASGGVDYQPGAGIVNATHAGGFILSNQFAGGGGSLTGAVNWLDANWLGGPSGTWFGNEGHPYAMWAVYKGLEALYGTEGAIPQISNLHTQTTALDPGAEWNWWEDYCQYLVGSQNSNGSWAGYGYWPGPMATAWYINILNATTGGEKPPPAIPEPATLVLLGSGLLGLAASRRKRMKK